MAHQGEGALLTPGREAIHLQALLFGLKRLKTRAGRGGNRNRGRPKSQETGCDGIVGSVMLLNNCLAMRARVDWAGRTGSRVQEGDMG